MKFSGTRSDTDVRMADAEMFDSDCLAYLQETMKEPLIQAFEKVAIIRPEESVEFVGRFLLHYADNISKNQQLQIERIVVTKGDTETQGLLRRGEVCI